MSTLETHSVKKRNESGATPIWYNERESSRVSRDVAHSGCVVIRAITSDTPPRRRHLGDTSATHGSSRIRTSTTKRCQHDESTRHGSRLEGTRNPDKQAGYIPAYLLTYMPIVKDREAYCFYESHKKGSKHWQDKVWSWDRAVSVCLLV